MSTRGYRARLDRLTRSANRASGQEKDCAPYFTIDPVLAKAIRDDCERLDEMARKPHAPSPRGGPLSAAEIEEQSMLRARIADKARTIVCPPGYGRREYLTDSDRLHKLYCKRISPPSCGGGPLNDAEDAEEAQLRARLEAFNETPEGRGRIRMFELSLKEFSWLSSAEYDELDSLRALYPPLPPDPNEPPRGEAWEAAIKRAKENMLERRHNQLARDRIRNRSADD